MTALTKKTLFHSSTQKQQEPELRIKKSAFMLFREKYPNGVGEIIDMRAVLR
jgi:hypothetical protein